MRRRFRNIVGQLALFVDECKNEALYAGTCRCGQPIYRRTRSGVAPKRCDQCRSNMRAKDPNRDAGPPQLMRRWIRTTRAELEQRGALSADDLMRQCTAVAMSETLGLPEDLSESILCAIDQLIANGENGLEIRKRLNSSSFGIKRAAEAGVATGLEAAIMSFGDDIA